MTSKTSVSRRNFMKSTAVVSSAIIGATAFSAFTEKGKPDTDTGKFPVNALPDFNPTDGASGLLFSQIGYELGFPVRIIVRLPKKELLQGITRCKLNPVSEGSGYETDFNYWGEIWGSNWWVADFRTIKEPGQWDIKVWNNNKCVFTDNGLIVNKNSLYWITRFDLCQ